MFQEIDSQAEIIRGINYNNIISKIMNKINKYYKKKYSHIIYTNFIKDIKMHI